MKTANESAAYIPLQPGLDQFTIRYWKPPVQTPSRLPATLFYEMKIHDPGYEYVHVLPDACVEILFELNPAKPVVWIGGSVIKTRKIRFRSGIPYFGIRFLPEHGIRVPDELIIDETVPSSFFQKQEDLIEQMLQDSSLEGCIRLFHGFVHSDRFPIRDVPDFILYAIRQSCLTKGNIEIHGLAEKTGYSVQYFRKKFEQYTGIPPKLFNRIIRFQNSLNRIMFQNCSLMDIVEEHGYYDQAHLIREFRNFNYLTPLQIKKSMEKQTGVHR